MFRSSSSFPLGRTTSIIHGRASWFAMITLCGGLANFFFAHFAHASENLVVAFDSAPTSHYLDRWMYPFNATPGQRIQAPTFSAIAEEMFDERDGQFLLALNTEAAGIPKGLPDSAYTITKLSLKLTEAVGEYPYDGTFDDFRTHLASGPLATADGDAGRPIELYGAGLRNGFVEFGFPDGAKATPAPVFSAASPFGGIGRGTRNVFATDADGNDISNSFDSLKDGANGYNTKPFAIGQATSKGQPLGTGTLVPAGAEYAFEVDLQDAAIRSYVQRGLSRGQLAFVVTSMHSTGELGQGSPYPNLATANHFAFSGPIFEIGWDTVDAIAGDFNGDGQLTAADIDLLSSTIRQSGYEAAMDLDANQKLDASDRKLWIEQRMQTTYGDANLDRFFNSLDLVRVFQAGQYEDGLSANSGWSDGDWDGNGDFDSADFLIAFQAGAYERNESQAIAIPEPASIGGIVWLSLFALLRRRPR